MKQRYINKYDSLKGVDVENLVDCTKKYSKPQLIAFLKSNVGANYGIVATQVELFQKAKNKLPGWLSAGCLFTRKSLEQSSSEALAAFKAGVVNGKTCVDLSGGLGVDDVAFSRVFESVISVDADQELNELVRYNLGRLGINNVSRRDDTAQAFIPTIHHQVDVIYVDADRRPDNGKKVYTLAGSSPDVIALMPQLLEKAETVLLKLSPMMDLSLLMNTFHQLSRVYVVGIKNEVKEVLAVLQPGGGNPVIEAVEVDGAGVPVKRFSGNTLTAPVTEGDTPCFYEPSNMIIKAGLSGDYAKSCGARLIHKNSHYMLAGRLINGYFGRRFIIIHADAFSKAKLKSYLKEKAIESANISTRNFVASVEELRNTFALEEGGEEYLFFTTDAAKNKLFWHCRKG